MADQLSSLTNSRKNRTEDSIRPFAKLLSVRALAESNFDGVKLVPAAGEGPVARGWLPDLGRPFNRSGSAGARKA